MQFPSIGALWPVQGIILSPSAKEILTDSSSIVRYHVLQERECGRGMCGQGGGLQESSGIRSIMQAE